MTKHLSASPFRMMRYRGRTARKGCAESVRITDPDEQDPRGQDEQCEKDRHEELPACLESLSCRARAIHIARVTCRFAAGSPECLVALWSSCPLLGMPQIFERHRKISSPAHADDRPAEVAAMCTRSSIMPTMDLSMPRGRSIATFSRPCRWERRPEPSRGAAPGLRVRPAVPLPRCRESGLRRRERSARSEWSRRRGR